MLSMSFGWQAALAGQARDGRGGRGAGRANGGNKRFILSTVNQLGGVGRYRSATNVPTADGAIVSAIKASAENCNKKKLPILNFNYPGSLSLGFNTQQVFVCPNAGMGASQACLSRRTFNGIFIQRIVSDTNKDIAVRIFLTFKEPLPIGSGGFFQQIVIKKNDIDILFLNQVEESFLEELERGVPLFTLPVKTGDYFYLVQSTQPPESNYSISYTPSNFFETDKVTKINEQGMMTLYGIPFNSTDKFSLSILSFPGFGLPAQSRHSIHGQTDYEHYEKYQNYGL